MTGFVPNVTGFVINMTEDTTTATGLYFNLSGHSLADLSITPLEQVRKNDTVFRKEREEFHIRRFNTLHKGLNRKFKIVRGRGGFSVYKTSCKLE